MLNNQFRKACNILFPNVVFHFSNNMFSFAALGQGSNEGLNLFAKKDGVYVTVQVDGSSTDVHDVHVLLNEVHAPELEDLLTTEQQQLEALRRVLKVLKESPEDTFSGEESDYLRGYKAGLKAKHELVIDMMGEIIDAN